MIYDVLLMAVTLALGGLLMRIIHSLYTESPAESAEQSARQQSGRR
ncbi:hypothetical protein [Arcanobacterium bovis]|nr:hypothetical protein [Arcanobacterium bovis]